MLHTVNESIGTALTIAGDLFKPDKNDNLYELARLIGFIFKGMDFSRGATHLTEKCSSLICAVNDFNDGTTH